MFTSLSCLVAASSVTLSPRNLDPRRSSVSPMGRGRHGDGFAAEHAVIFLAPGDVVFVINHSVVRNLLHNVHRCCPVMSLVFALALLRTLEGYRALCLFRAGWTRAEVESVECIGRFSFKNSVRKWRFGPQNPAASIPPHLFSSGVLCRMLLSSLCVTSGHERGRCGFPGVAKQRTGT